MDEFSKEALMSLVEHTSATLHRLHKQSAQSSHLNIAKGWPLCDNHRIIIHLKDIDATVLEEGDAYFRIHRNSSGLVQLVLRQVMQGELMEFPVLDSDYKKLFTMDWTQNLNTGNDQDLTALLQHCLVAVEEGLQRMRWTDVKLSAHGYREKDTNVGTTEQRQHRTQRALQSCDAPDTEATREARAVHRLSDGKLIKEEPPPCNQHIDPPGSIHEVNVDILKSGIAVLPGIRDILGGAVILVYCRNSCWQHEDFSSTELAKLLMYYHTVPREEVRSHGFTVIVDARSTTLTVLNALLETLYAIEANLPGAISMVHVLADRVAQSLLFRSPVFRPQVELKINLVTSLDTLCKFVDQTQLPPEIGGTRAQPHSDWVEFRLKFEPFVSSCRSAAKFLVSIMQEMTEVEGMPGSVQETGQLIEQHKNYIKTAFEDSRLEVLQRRGEEMMQELEADKDVLADMDDYRDSMKDARILYKQVQETVFKLVKLADDRLHKLEQCMQLRQFEEESRQVISWVCDQGEDLLSRHSDISDNLKGIRVQQKEFEKFYFSAMTHVEKGNDMLEEASMISQSGNFDEVSGIRDIAKELKARLQSFTERLENVRENIESASKCYHLLDKTYEWALNAMKYVASMKMDSSTTLQGVEKLLTSIDLYLREHPPIDVATFDLMLEIAMNLKNEKLHDQCKVAKARCMETDQLLKVRQSTFKKAREKMLLEQQQRRRNSMGYGGLVTFRERHQASCRQWEPHEELVLSTPGVVLRRRSYAGKPSAPLYSPAAQAFKDKEHDMNLLEYEEHLFSEGLITEDMSDRIVASLPKTLGDGTLRTSRDSLRGSRESLQGSCENLSRDQKSSSLPRDVPPSLPSQFNQSGTTLNKHNKPHRKIMRRTNSAMQFGEHEDKSSRDSRRSGHTLSMITGSSESLPSMPEEEELNTNNGDREKFAWSPVPVNTHLMFRQSRGLVSHQSMADLRLTEEDVKRRRTLQMIMSEMIQTERDYVRALQFVIENYVSEVLRDDVPQPLRGKRNVIFGNLENIYQFHSQYFLAELEQCESNPYAVGSCFLQHRPEFYLYSLYNKNKPKSDALMIEYGSKFFKQKQFELQDRMDLGSYLLKPVQRMGKYSLLLKQVIKECPDTDQDYGDLKNALEMVKFQLRHGNDLLAMDSLRDFDVNLQEQGQLLRQDEFLVWQGRRKCLRHIFLFEDLVLFSKTRRNATGHDIYVYKNSIKTSDIGLTETVGESGYKFEIWFRRRKYGETYVLQAHSTEVKNAWVREISRLLWKQAIKNRENRMCEMANMGIGNKPCLDIKPSEDNINDRFVNIAVSGRVPRARNSIAVSSADHIKNGNKRPHSIISVSSTSSSNSSQSSSSYGQNSTHDSSGISRSFTICSNESGIVTDMSTDDQSPSQCLPRLGVQHSDSGASLDTMSFSNSTPNSPCGLPSMQELAESNV